MQPEKTVVIFRAERKAPHDVTAVFPYEPAGPHGYEMSCYAHVGQHSACTYEWFLTTRPATPAEYADLETELENYGPPDAHYRLTVRKRIAHNRRIEESRARAQDVGSSDLCKTLSARVAREHGFDVHHDILGWYVVESHESEPDDGYSLGFDGRPHFELCFEAWRYAANQIRKSSDAYEGVR